MNSNEKGLKKAMSTLKDTIEGNPSKDICTFCDKVITNGHVIFKEGLPPIHADPCYMEILAYPKQSKVKKWHDKMFTLKYGY